MTVCAEFKHCPTVALKLMQPEVLLSVILLTVAPP